MFDRVLNSTSFTFSFIMFLFSGDISRDVPKSLPNLYIETFCIEDVSPEINFIEDV